MRFKELYESIVASDECVDEAVEHFGLTDDPDETGYILRDGRRLDFSGRSQTSEYVLDRRTMKYKLKKPGRDWMAGQRSVDHRDVSVLGFMSKSGTDAILEFMEKTGASRYQRNDGIEVDGMPSDALLRAAVGDFRRDGDPMRVDVWVVRKNGKELLGMEFKRPDVQSVKTFISSIL